MSAAARRTDLLVIGGGPAGAGLAALAAGAGVSVVLVERSQFPRDKVCGEFVSAEGCRVLERLGVLDELRRAGASRMERCRISDRRGVPIDLGLPSLPRHGREAIGVSRACMDTALLELAARRGADVRQRWTATAPLVEGDRVVGFRVRRLGPADEVVELRASVVVAADGRRSVLARRLHPFLCDPPRTGPRSWFGLEVHLDADPAALDGRVELHLFEGGYAGLAPIEGSRINLCAMVHVRALRDCGGSPERLLQERMLANPCLAEAVRDGKPAGAWNSVGPLRFGVRRATAAGALFVGDAAGTIDPFAGEGMSHALRAAEIALPFALEAATRGALDPRSAAGYECAWRAAFGPVTRRVRAIGMLFARTRLAGLTLGTLRRAPRGLTRRIVAATRTGLEA